MKPFITASTVFWVTDVYRVIAPLAVGPLDDDAAEVAGPADGEIPTGPEAAAPEHAAASATVARIATIDERRPWTVANEPGDMVELLVAKRMSSGAARAENPASTLARAGAVNGPGAASPPRSASLSTVKARSLGRRGQLWCSIPSLAPLWTTRLFVISN
ncbi:MAG: hypothetical protein NVS9B8_01950 [Candidatus Limnocylindrales bacterium]